MMKDECILVNYMDEVTELVDSACCMLFWKATKLVKPHSLPVLEVVGHNNKYNCHKFAPGQPRGLLSETKVVDSRSAYSTSVLTSRFIIGAQVLKKVVSLSTCQNYACSAGTEPFPCCCSTAKIAC